MKGRAWITLLLVFAFGLAAPGTALGLQCREDFQQRAFGAADVVVLATAVEVVVPADDGARRVTLRVSKLLKGKASEPLVVNVDGFKRGFPFERGKSYLVFASRTTDGGLWVHDCGGTIALEHAGPALAMIGQRVPEASAAPVQSSAAALPSAEPSAGVVTAPSAPPPVATLPSPVAVAEPPVAAATAPREAPTGGCAGCAVAAPPCGLDRSKAALLVLAACSFARRRRRSTRGSE